MTSKEIIKKHQELFNRYYEKADPYRICLCGKQFGTHQGLRQHIVDVHLKPMAPDWLESERVREGD